MDKQALELLQIFEDANDNFIKKDLSLFEIKVSERTLCGALMYHLYNILQKTKFLEYYVDVEYNRNKGGKLKTLNKTIKGLDEKIITINCDLIVHSRGENILQDNLIAIEMKKSYRSLEEKECDRERLICLSKDSFNDVWSFDGKCLPEHVCRYKLGIYYEVNSNKREILLEYYYKGQYKSNKIINY